MNRSILLVQNSHAGNLQESHEAFLQAKHCSIPRKKKEFSANINKEMVCTKSKILTKGFQKIGCAIITISKVTVNKAMKTDRPYN